MNTQRESIIARSPKGAAVLAFETRQRANQWIKENPTHRLKFYKQIIIEQEVLL